MNNKDFLLVIKSAFEKYRVTSSRSNEKLRILHSAIAIDIEQRLNSFSDGYEVFSLAKTKDEGSKNEEKEITGRYMNKKVDIVVAKNDEYVAGFAIKFIMSSYKPNSVNYFENMLGETANIRAKGIPYFQIIIIPEKMPHFEGGEVSKTEVLSKENLEKYIFLDSDDINTFFHTPNKILLETIQFENLPENLSELKSFYKTDAVVPIVKESNKFKNFFQMENNIINNDYEKFADKTCHLILSL